MGVERAATESKYGEHFRNAVSYILTQMSNELPVRQQTGNVVSRIVFLFTVTETSL